MVAKKQTSPIDMSTLKIINVADGTAATDAASKGQVDTKVGKGDHVFSVKDYGAIGDGTTDDTAAINAAIVAAGPSKGVVYFSPGIYLVSMAGVGTLRHAITVSAGITLRGAGCAASVIKVQAAVGDYMAVITGVAISTDLTGLTVEDLTVNQNNSNNAITAGASITAMTSTNCRFAVLAYTGSRLTVRRCRFTDIDSTNVIVFNTTGGTDFTIEDNLFDLLGTSVTQHDHSTIYTNGDRTHVTGNTFVGVLGGLGSTTAIETHGSQQIVTGNNVTNYYTGANLCGVSMQSIGVVFSANTIRRCAIGVQLWARTSTPNTSVWGMEDVVVSGNTIEIDMDTWVPVLPASTKNGIVFDSSATLGFHNVSIADNLIRYMPFTVALSASDGTGAVGIRFYRPGAAYAGSDTNIAIDGNTVENPPSMGIYLQPKSTMQRLRIRNNLIINPGTNNSGAFAAAFKTGISLTMQSAQGTFEDVRVNGNTIIDTRATHVIDAGIDTQFVTSCSNAEAVDNVLRVAEAAASVPAFRASASAGSAFYVRYKANKYVAITAPTLYGSQIIDSTNGVTYSQTTFPSGTTWISYTPGSTSTDVQTFTANGTWTKPSWVTATSEIIVTCISGGGGGGSGRRGASATVNCGGGGGAGAGLSVERFTGAQVGATETVTVGTGGAGAAAVTVDSTSGNTGTTGGNSTFGSGNGKCRAVGGSGGSGGVISPANSGFGGSAGWGTSPGGAGGSASTTGGIGGNAAGGAGASGGGAGGGLVITTPVAVAGGSGQAAMGNGLTLAGAAGAANANGSDATAPADLTVPYGGAGGGGGGSSTTGVGGNGGAGCTYGGGGGGGGASLNGFNSGAGGNGAAGIVQVITRS